MSRKNKPCTFSVFRNHNTTFIQTGLHLVLYDDRHSTSLHVTTMPRPLDELAYTLWSPINPRFLNSCWKPHLSVNWTPLRLSIASTPCSDTIGRTPSYFIAPYYQELYTVKVVGIIPIPWTLRFNTTDSAPVSLSYATPRTLLHWCRSVLGNTNISVILKWHRLFCRVEWTGLERDRVG